MHYFRNRVDSLNIFGFLCLQKENAEVRGKLHDAFKVDNSNENKSSDNNDKSLKAYYKEFKKVVDEADVILEIIDARDPLGTRCPQVEQAVNEIQGNKRLVLVLNKAGITFKNM